MSKMVLQKLDIETDDSGRPLRVGEECRPVLAVLDRWYDTGCWWEGESLKLFFRLEIEDLGVWEVYFDLGDRSWKLYKIYD